MFQVSPGVSPVRAARVTPDRRRSLRPSTPGRRAADLARAGILAALWSLAMAASASAQTAAIKFGFDTASARQARDLGMPVAYGSIWAGAWNQKWGWGSIERQLQTAKAEGVTPVVQWWYWGDDISPTCVEQGCSDRYHAVPKDRATWSRLSTELADLIVRVMGSGSGALVIVETEFNKNGIENYEPFDGYLADQMGIFRQRGMRTIVGFGNWGRSRWASFDRAIGQAELMGVMALQSSVRDATTYLSGAEMLISAARYNQTTFGKPSFVTDVAFSSYPEPDYERYQDTVVRDIFRRIGELRDAGVQGMIWRMLADDPEFDTANYHGMAERFWGLRHADGSPKLAFTPFLSGMLAERDRELAPQPVTEPAPSPEPTPVEEPAAMEPAPGKDKDGKAPPGRSGKRLAESSEY